MIVLIIPYIICRCYQRFMEMGRDEDQYPIEEVGQIEPDIPRQQPIEHNDELDEQHSGGNHPIQHDERE